MRLAILCAIFLAGISFPVPASAQQEWQAHRTQHYMVFYKAAPETFIETLGTEAENLFGEIADQMGFESYPRWRQDDRIRIFVYNDQNDYEADGPGNRRDRTRAMAHARKRAISTFVQERPSFFERTLPHELGHIFFYEFIGRRQDLPGWFVEGVAMMQEKTDQSNRERMAKELIQEYGYFSLSDIPAGKKTDIDYFYPVAYSATNYLFSRISGNKRQAFFELLRQGQTFEAALQEVTNNKISTVDRLNQDWVESLNSLTAVSNP